MYDPKLIEPKWQKKWEELKIHQAKDFDSAPKYYCLDMFPYPSGAGLHVGHPEGYTATDIISRYKRMRGYNVLHPIGWDAFGLPTENYAIKMQRHPAEITKENVATFTRQIKSLGFSYDWQREINTSSPEYYKWTQWLFLLLYKNGLAYKKEAPVNWCEHCKTVLADEQVISGKCERCKNDVIQKELEQWFFKVTQYADELLAELDNLDWPDALKTTQRNWIGRSEGLEEEWQVEGMDLKLKTFTTWPHTSWGSTFMVIAPEHPIIDKLVKGTDYEKGAKEFCQRIIQEKIKDPMNVEKKKEGFFMGRYVINHLNGRRMPLYIANFAIYEYGTGIVKCTPTHDQRDFEFAKQYGLDLIPVIYPKDGEKLDPQKMTEAYTGEGLMMNAGNFDGMATEQARKAIGDFTVEQGNGRWAVNYKIRDWLVSRQRYWGAPIPIIYCEKCGMVPVPEKDLPITLPDDVDFRPTGESPLTRSKKFHQVKCPNCQGKARRESDTLDTFVCSSWYFFRYCDTQNDQAFADKGKIKYWLPVDLYIGGMEHAVGHLIYSRFITKVLRDSGYINFGEPFSKVVNQGIILAEDGRKMSKSYGNVINPDEVVDQYGADTMRLYEMFMGPLEETKPWSTKSILGVKRFLEKVWQLGMKEKKEEKRTMEIITHKTIKKVTEDIENFRFNTAISAMMIWLNEIMDLDYLPILDFKNFLKILAPFAPHIAEELFEKFGGRDSIFKQEWPSYDPKLTIDKTITLVVQINGKVRDRLEAPVDLTQKEAEELVLQSEKIQKLLAGKEIKKIIFVPNRLVNIVV